MKTEIDYKEILDSYGIKYRKGTPEEVDASIKNMDKIFNRVFDKTFRDKGQKLCGRGSLDYL